MVASGKLLCYGILLIIIGGGALGALYLIGISPSLISNPLVLGGWGIGGLGFLLLICGDACARQERKDDRIAIGECDWCGSSVGGNYYVCRDQACDHIFCSQKCRGKHEMDSHNRY